MAALRLSIPATDLARRLKERLRGDSPDSAASVVWQRDSDSVLVKTDTLTVSLLDAWLLCNLDLQTDQTGPQTLQFVYFLGRVSEGDGLQAACTIHAATSGAAQIAAAWGSDLQRVLWDAVLDAIETMVYHTESSKKGKITVGGFHCTADAIFVDLLAGDH